MKEIKYSQADFFDDQIKFISQTRLDLSANKIKIIPTFSPALNSQFKRGGLLESNLMLLLGKTGGGKTYWATNWIVWLIRENFKVLFFSMDMKKSDVLTRLLRIMLRSDVYGVERDLTTDFENSVFPELMMSHYYTHCNINENAKTLPEMEIVIRDWEPDIVFVDHIQLIRTKVKNFCGNSELIADTFQAWKKKYKTAYVLLSQLKKSNQMNKRDWAKVPDIDDSRTLSETEAADVILGLARPGMDQDCADFQKKETRGRLIKNRLNDSWSPVLTWNYDEKTTIIKDV
jgi:replicative DNA helicase